jgi:hypothetical protein
MAPILIATLQELGQVHARVVLTQTTAAQPTKVTVTFGDPHARVALVDRPAVVRQLLTDAVAQIDAITAQGGESGSVE